MQGNENSEQCESDLSFRGMHGEFKATHQKMHADHIIRSILLFRQ